MLPGRAYVSAAKKANTRSRTPHDNEPHKNAHANAHAMWVATFKHHSNVFIARMSTGALKGFA